jgi:ABC-type enterobactin transport system permease subunit
VSTAEARLKRSIASLVGGIATAICVLVLWLLIAGTASVPLVLAGILVAALVGTWVRLADL